MGKRENSEFEGKLTIKRFRPFRRLLNKLFGKNKTTSSKVLVNEIESDILQENKAKTSNLGSKQKLPNNIKVTSPSQSQSSDTLISINLNQSLISLSRKTTTGLYNSLISPKVKLSFTESIKKMLGLSQKSVVESLNNSSTDHSVKNLNMAVNLADENQQESTPVQAKPQEEPKSNVSPKHDPNSFRYYKFKTDLPQRNKPHSRAIASVLVLPCEDKKSTPKSKKTKKHQKYKGVVQKNTVFNPMENHVELFGKERHAVSSKKSDADFSEKQQSSTDVSEPQISATVLNEKFKKNQSDLSDSDLSFSKVKKYQTSHSSIDLGQHHKAGRSFFSTRSHTFKNVRESYHRNSVIPYVCFSSFINACEEFSVLFDWLKSPVLSQIKADIRSGVEQLKKSRRKQKSPTDASLLLVVQPEIKKELLKELDNKYYSLLWLLRTLTTCKMFFTNLLDPKSVHFGHVKKSFLDAYSKVLEKHHNWITKKAFYTAAKTVPPYDVLLPRLVDPSYSHLKFTEIETIVSNDYLNYSKDMGFVLNELRKYYESKNLIV